LSSSNDWPVNAAPARLLGLELAGRRCVPTIAAVASIRDRNRFLPWRKASSARFRL
jgi:hypothetical protein